MEEPRHIVKIPPGISSAIGCPLFGVLCTHASHATGTLNPTGANARLSLGMVGSASGAGSGLAVRCSPMAVLPAKRLGTRVDGEGQTQS